MTELSPAQLPIDALAPAALGKVGQHVPSLDLEALGITRDGAVTRAGAVALAKHRPDPAPPWLQVVVRSWPCSAASARTSDVAPLEERRLGPPLLPQLVELLASEIAVELTPDDAPLDPARDIARELVGNALIHRDYGPEAEGRSVEIDLCRGEVVVSSPGGLAGRLDADAPEALARNPRLAFLAEALGCGTQTGRGWVTAVRTGRAYGYAPVVLEQESRTVVALRLDHARALDVAESRAGGAETRLRLPADSWDDKVAELLSDREWWPPVDIAERLGIPRSTLTQVLRRLQERGVVEAATTARRSRKQRYRLARGGEGR